MLIHLIESVHARTMRFLLPFLCLAFAGCLNIKYDEAAATALTQSGQASIRGSQEKTRARFTGPRVIRYLLDEVDDPPARPKRPGDVLPLTPGNRKLAATAYLQIPRFGGFDVYLFNAELKFTAVAGRPYEIRGRGNERHVALGVVDLKEGKLVSAEVEGTPELSTSQRAPILILIP